MQEFDPRRSPARLAPRLMVGLLGAATLMLAWRLTGGDAQASMATPNLSDFGRLQHAAFVQSEVQPGFQRAESVTVRMRPGETLEAAVLRTGVGSGEATNAAAKLTQALGDGAVRTGLSFEAAVAEPLRQAGPARLMGISLRTGPTTALTLSRSFDGALLLHELQEAGADQTTVAQGEMRGSLYESAARAGASPAITAEVVKLFAHRLDFSRDIEAGNRFNLVFDRRVAPGGRTMATGDLLFAEIQARAGLARFYRFQRDDGAVEYFDETGKNIKGFLLHTPVDGARITSTFGMRRHPILGYTRAHQGVDFGASTGTPILAAGDGVIKEAKWSGGYGNWLLIRHSSEWETGYGHISRYAPGIKPGVSVRQGQVIAYVGATGLATGPHLHYEVWRDGERVNPIGANVPQGTVLGGEELQAFKLQRAAIDKLIVARGADNWAAPTRLARANPNDPHQAGLRPAQKVASISGPLGR
jgi:murein DD-endopeptidase MepM/ murein hydrolase activator NlpD